jgi:uncharacterized repeat protein (TIGR01451 family)
MKKLITSIYLCLISFISFGNTSDTVPPVWTSQLPPDITVECNQVPAAEIMTATDDSGVVTISFSETVIQGSCPSSYMLTRVWTATDPSGNNITYSQQINVQDITPPVLTVAYNPSLTVNCNAIPNAPNLTFTDNCNSAVSENYSENNSAVTNGTYTITRTWTASDACGNISLFTQNITVDCSSQIDAVNDNGSTVNGYTGGISVSNVLINDTLNGIPVNFNTVTLSMVSNDQGVTLNLSNGSVIVSPNTPNGFFTLVYQICEINNPNNCDVATVTVSAFSSAIDAVNDGPFVFNSTSGTSQSVLLNDTLDGVPVTPNNVNLTAVSYSNAGLTLNPNGTITVNTNTPSGQYTIIYQICEILNPTNCDTAIATIVVNNPLGINLVGAYSDYNNDGFVNVGDVINYQITLTNNESTAITNLIVCQSSMTVSGGTLASLNAGISNSTFFTGVHVITQAEINAGNVFGSLCICGDSGVQNCLNGINTPLNQSNGVKLQTFIDSNSNGIKDASESFFSGGSFNYSVNGGTTANLYSSTGINYLYESNPATTYNFSYSVPNSYYSCPTTYTNITVPNGSGITTYNFPITILPYTDLAVYLTPSGGPKPGFNYYNTITIKNHSNQTISSGTVTFIKDNAITIATLPLGATANTTGFTYNFTNLLPNEIRYIYVLLQVPTIPTVGIGQLITNTASITIPSADVNLNNNTSTLIQDIRSSYDPNDKQEVHGGKILHSTFTANNYLTYTIQFENTGNSNAVNIKVDDVLDAKLNESSIVMIASSHDYVLNRVGANLSWKFNGINLPPSVPNTQTGHGYITFQIKPKPGYAIGDIIPNFANIYFDFNPAIVTNVCNTQFVSSLSNQNFAFNNLNYYPNPVKNSLTISNSSTIDEVEITSILGQKMISKKVNDLQAEINLSELSNGVYFVKVSSDGQEKIVKIVIE